MKPLIFLALSGLLTAPLQAQSDKVRIFISQSRSWKASGGVFGGDDIFLGRSIGGSRPQTIELMNNFGKKCPELTITIHRDKADYVVFFDREAKDIFQKDSKIAVFNLDGDLVYSGSTRTVGNAVKDACAAIRRAEKNRP